MFGGANPLVQHAASGLMGAAAANLYAPLMDKLNGDGDGTTNGTNTINAATKRAKRIQAGLMRRMASGGNARATRELQVMPSVAANPSRMGGGGNWRQFSGMSENC
jgi:hypothetical protein